MRCRIYSFSAGTSFQVFSGEKGESTQPIWSAFGKGFSWSLFSLFLLGKSNIHNLFENWWLKKRERKLQSEKNL